MIYFSEKNTESAKAKIEEERKKREDVEKKLEQMKKKESKEVQVK